MTTLEVWQVAAKGGAQVVRPTKGREGQWDAKDWFTGSHRGWVLLDSFSANAALAVHAKLGEANRAKMESFGPIRGAVLAFEVLNGAQATR